MQPVFVSPCLVCRRRFRWNGRPLFTACFCVNYGRNVTAGALVMGALMVGGVWWYIKRKA